MGSFISRLVILLILLYIYNETEHSHPTVSGIAALLGLILAASLLFTIQKLGFDKGADWGRGEKKRTDMMEK